MPGEHDEGYHLAKRVQRLAPDQFPLALAAGAEVFTAFDDRFDHSLWLIIAGLQQSLAMHKSSRQSNSVADFGRTSAASEEFARPPLRNDRGS